MLLHDNILFNVIGNDKLKSFKESIDTKRYAELNNSVKISEDDRYTYIENLPLAFGNVENKNKRIYDQEALKKGVDFFNKVKSENPYFAYMFDGHSDEDTYSGIVGKVTKMQINEDLKGVFINIKLNKGSKIYPLLDNIIKDGDPISVSMRILAPNSYKIKKDELKSINEDIIFLEDDSKSVSKIFGGDEIEYITGDAFLQRVDLTWFPSFNKSYGQKGMIKDESVNIKNALNAACMMKEKFVCLTDTCKYRYTMRDFVDLINKDESILTIKDNPDMYDDIMKFAYFNMTDFNFNEITDRKYLQKHLQDSNDVDKEFINDAISHLDSTSKAIFDYILNNKETLTVKDIVANLYDTLIKLTENENIFYQIIMVNYVHWLLLSKLLYDKIDNLQVQNIPDFTKKFENKINNNNKYNEYLIKFLENIKNNDNIYDVLNSIFSFIYNILDNFGDKLSPNILLSETAINFNKSKKIKLLFKKGKYIMAKKKKCKRKKKK